MNMQTETSTPKINKLLLSLALFGLALLPRAWDLTQFVTADEAKWVHRSAQFLAALLQGDLAATTVNLTPGVTTTWLGSLGLVAYHWLNQAALNLPLTDWLQALPPFRTELDVLAAARWPMALFTALSVVIIYRLTCRLVGDAPALIAAIFIALDPHPVALARVLGHDAPAAMFMTMSLLWLLAFQTRPAATAPRSDLILSGAAAGLAFLSKAPALFLILFAGLIFAVKVWQNQTALFFWLKRFGLWLAVAWLVFVAGWPAAWIDPLGRPVAVIENAFLSATDQEEADSEEYWLVPDLGPAYYLVHGAFKLSPLVMVGLGLLAIKAVKHRPHPPTNQSGTQPTNYLTHPLLWLALFVLLFAIFMTLGEKRSARYILPVFPPLALLAATGWLWLYQTVISPHPGRGLTAFILILMVSAAAILAPYAPYYFTYFNPLVGGPLTAPRLVKLGWGEGLDQVGRYLQREAPGSRVGTAYASTVAPFFTGDLSDVSSGALDYVVLYTKQVQAGRPLPTAIRYYRQLGSLFSVDINGIHYADVYPGPAVQPTLALKPGLDHAILPKPIGFRPLTPYGRLGELLPVDVLWLTDPQQSLPATASVVSLEPTSAFDFLEEHNHEDGTPVEPHPVNILAEGAGRLTQPVPNLTISRHILPLPTDLPRGPYALLVDGRPLGEIELRGFEIPADFNRIEPALFGKQIALTGYQYEPSADFIGVTLAWQAQKNWLPDYTVFVQLLNAETGERVAGSDSWPVNGEWPTSRWVKDEVVTDRHVLPVPPDLPPDSYTIIVGLYRADTMERLTRPNGDDHWLLPWTYIKNGE